MQYEQNIREENGEREGERREKEGEGVRERGCKKFNRERTLRNGWWGQKL
jgi:hypothetical protein